MAEISYAVELADGPANYKKYGKVHVSSCSALIDPEPLGKAEEIVENWPWPESADELIEADFCKCAKGAWGAVKKSLS